MKTKPIILSFIAISLVAGLTSCNNEKLTDKEIIVSKFNSLNDGNFTLSYTLNDIKYEDVFTKDYYYIAYLNNGSILLDTISDTKITYDFKITNDSFILKGQSFNEEHTLQEQTKLNGNKLKNTTISLLDLTDSKYENKYVISDEYIVKAFSNQLDFSNIKYLHLYLDENKDLIVDLVGFDPIQEIYYIPDAGSILVKNINSSKLDVVDNFLKTYVKPTQNLVNKADNLFSNVSFKSAIYDFILDDNMALLQKTTLLDIYNNYVKITDIDTSDSATSFTYQIQEDKETLKIVGVDGTNNIVNKDTSKKYNDFNFVGKNGFELDKFAKINQNDEYYTYLGSNATELCYSITQDPQILNWKIQDIKVVEENSKVVQFDFFTSILQDKLTGQYFYRRINTKVLDEPNKIEETIKKTPSKDDELIKSYLNKLSKDNSVFKATEIDNAWDGNRKLEFIKGDGFYLKQSLVNDGENYVLEKEGDGYYKKNGKIYSFKYNNLNEITLLKESSFDSLESIINFNLSSEVLYLNNDKIKAYGDIINIGSSIPFVDNPLTIDPSSIEFNIKNDTISSLNLSYYGGIETINFDYENQIMDETLLNNIDKEIAKQNPSEEFSNWSKYDSDVIINGLNDAFGTDFANNVPYLHDEAFLSSNTFDGWFNDYDEKPYYFIICFIEKVDYEYSNKYKELLLSLGYKEDTTNSFIKDNIKIDIINDEDSYEFLHIYKLD